MKYPRLFLRRLALTVAAAGSFLLTAAPVYGQLQWGLEFDTRTRVVQPGAGGAPADTLANPWAGGLSAVAFSKMDFDQDGTPDLLAWDGRAQRPLTFVARAGRWVHAPAYEAAFPPSDGTSPAFFARLRDYDGDGRPDLFISAGQYVRLYRHEVTAAAPGFEFRRVSAPYLKTEPAPQPQPLFNLEAPPWTTWDLSDVDADGDLDLLAFRPSAPGQLILHRNVAGPGAVPVFREDPAWGGITWCGGRQHTYSFMADTTQCRPAPPVPAGAPEHINPAATLTAADLTADGAPDLLLGHEYIADLALLTNLGSGAQARFAAASVVAPLLAGSAQPVRVLHAPLASYEDVTFDQQPDLLISPWLVLPPTQLEDLFDARRSALLFPAAGGSFAFQQPDFLQGGMLDVGEYAAPTLGDLDGDGDLDLLVGNQGDYFANPAGLLLPAAFRAQLRFYRNIGTAQRPVFRLDDADFGGFSALNRRALVPVLADLDGDGNVDLVVRYATDAVGSGAAPLNYVRNTASAGQLAVFPTSALAPFAFQIAARGNRDLPCFYDLDGDGRRDMLLGTDQYVDTVETRLHFLRNRGGTLDTAFARVDADFGRLTISGLTPTGLSPAIADLDGDGQPELLTADDSGELRVWPQVLAAPTVPTARLGNLIRNDLTLRFGPARLGMRPVLTTGDLDADGRAEVLIGTIGGGVRLLRAQPNGTVGTRADVGTPPPFTVYPNPATTTLHVSWATAAPAGATLELVDLFGRAVRRQVVPAGPAELSVRGVRPGVYLLRVQPATGAPAHQRRVVLAAPTD